MSGLKPAKLTLPWRLAVRVLRGYLRLVHATGTWRYDYSPAVQALINERRPYIAAFMHGRLFMMPYAKPLSHPFVMLTSHNRAGSLTSALIKPFNIDHVRGSGADPRKPEKDKGGSAGLRGLLSALRNGIPVGVTPDGPRGPAGSVAPGLVTLAKLSGVPIIPVAFAADRVRIGRGWDRFILPLPFCSGVIGAAEPVYVSRESDEAACRTQLEEEFVRLHARLDAAAARVSA